MGSASARPATALARAGRRPGSSLIVAARSSCHLDAMRLRRRGCQSAGLDQRCRIDPQQARVIADEAADERRSGQRVDVVALERDDLPPRELQLLRDVVERQAAPLRARGAAAVPALMRFGEAAAAGLIQAASSGPSVMLFIGNRRYRPAWLRAHSGIAAGAARCTSTLRICCPSLRSMHAPSISAFRRGRVCVTTRIRVRASGKSPAL